MINEKLREEMVDIALNHIQKVNANPYIKLANIDAYDAWIKYDDNWDLNVHEANFGMGEDSSEEGDPSKFEWYCTAYPVRKGKDGYEHVITEEGEYLFRWKKKGEMIFVTS